MNSKHIFRIMNNAKNVNKGNDVIQRALRQSSRSMSASVSVSQTGKEKETFRDILPGFIEALVTNPKFSQVPEVGNWVKEVLDYNLIGGKTTRGLTTVFAYEILEKPENLTEESLRLARTLGWCVEMLQTYLIMVDDIMDGSLTRRGVPCWYRMPNIGLGAINDSILIYSSIFEIINAYFSKTPHYVNVIEQFNEALLFTSMGQHLDYMTAHRNKNDYSMFTVERYCSIVKHKTSYYTYKLPIMLGLTLANIDMDKTTLAAVEDLCFELGKLFQIQDDYIDCFGVESVTGKKGTDIQEGKCSWLAVSALQRCNDKQLATFIDNYASQEIEHIDTIKRLYEELELPQLYREQERILYEGIIQRAYALPLGNLSALFLKLLDMMYKREQ